MDIIKHIICEERIRKQMYDNSERLGFPHECTTLELEGRSFNEKILKLADRIEELEAQMEAANGHQREWGRLWSDLIKLEAELKYQTNYVATLEKLMGEDLTAYRKLQKQLADMTLARDEIQKMHDITISQLAETEGLLKELIPLIPPFRFDTEQNLPISNYDYLKSQKRWR